MSKIQNENQNEIQKQPLSSVIKSFTKIGLIGFGGGSALIPVIEKEVCDDNNYIDPDEYSNYAVIANITPGAMPLKLGSLIGYDMAGNLGMFLAAVFTALPGVLISLGLLALLDILGATAIQTIEKAALGISFFIIYLMMRYIAKVMRDSKKANFSKPAFTLMISSFILTFGKEIREGISRLGFEVSFTETIPFFDISTINVLLLVFFLIFFTGGDMRCARFRIALCISLAYLLMFGKSPLINIGIGSTIFQILILIASVIMLVRDSKEETLGRGKVRLDWGGAAKKSLPFLISTTVLFAICFIINSESLVTYLIQGVVSTSTTFGGGAAYLPVADEFFVESGTVSPNEFYSRILPIANAMPGPILVKILASVGFVIGYEESLAFAFLLGITGMMIAATSSCVICIYVAEVYRSFSFLSIFKVLKQWILPVICGLLLSTTLSMLNEVFQISATYELAKAPMFGILIFIYAMVHFLGNKFKINDVFLILLSAIVSIIGIMIF